MPKWLTDFFETKPGKIIGVVFAVLAVCVGGYFLYQAVFALDPAAQASTDRVYIDSESGKQFGYTVRLGDTIPVMAPGGKKTGYPAEPCYWTADGKVKSEPTYVLVNAAIGKPGPTFCPDCHRLVVPQNPNPLAGDKPPPTEAEYKKRHPN